MKKAWMIALAGMSLLAALPAQGQETVARDWREAVEAALASAKTGLEKSPISDATPLAVLPVQGDEGGLVTRRLRGILGETGKNVVTWREDPMLMTLLETIDWSQAKIGIVDKDTVGQIGRLLSAKILITGWLETTAQRARSRDMELELNATDVETGRLVWSGVFKSEPDGKIQPIEPIVVAPMAMNVEVRVQPGQGAEQEGDEIGVYARGRLAALGYRVGTRQEADMALTLAPTSTLFDREGEWQVYQGTLTATLEMLGRDARVLGEVNLSGKGAPGLDDEGHRSLAYTMERQLGPWLDRTLDPSAAEYAAARVEFRLKDRVETAGDHGAIVSIREALEKLSGVRSAELVSQDDIAGRVAFKVVYKPVDVPDGLVNPIKANPKLMDYLWQ